MIYFVITEPSSSILYLTFILISEIFTAAIIILVFLIIIYLPVRTYYLYISTFGLLPKYATSIVI